jgi:3-deoxy-D-manno-octulosonic-acid transferase
MARWLYTLLFYLAMPLIWLRLFWRSRGQPEYRQHLCERLGYGPSAAEEPCIWLHAVSVGETRAAAPLVEALLAAHPGQRLLLTHMTPTGRAAASELLQRHPQRLLQAYLPYDLPGACERFLDRFQPSLGLLMETEIWPNLIAAAKRRHLPLLLVNARLSARSQRGYRRLRALIEPALSSLIAVAAQSAADAARLQSLAAHPVAVVGNLKFDVTPAADKLALGRQWRQAIGKRPVLLAASTRDGEEALLLTALASLRIDDLLLLLVPRHPQRFDEVAQLLADLALIGGSWLPFGGQNLIEAAACACPVLIGPHMFNFAQASADALAAGAACRVADVNNAARLAGELLNDEGRLSAMRQAAQEFSRTHQGATARTLALIDEMTSSTPAAVPAFRTVG